MTMPSDTRTYLKSVSIQVAAGRHKLTPLFMLFKGKMSDGKAIHLCRGESLCIRDLAAGCPGCPGCPGGDTVSDVVAQDAVVKAVISSMNMSSRDGCSGNPTRNKNACH